MHSALAKAFVVPSVTDGRKRSYFQCLSRAKREIGGSGAGATQPGYAAGAPAIELSVREEADSAYPVKTDTRTMVTDRCASPTPSDLPFTTRSTHRSSHPQNIAKSGLPSIEADARGDRNAQGADVRGSGDDQLN